MEWARRMTRYDSLRDEAALPARRLIVGITGALLFVIGGAALLQTIQLDHFDQWGFRVGCGHGFSANLFQAGLAEGQGVDFIEQCRGALQARRSWAIPLMASGCLLFLGAVVMWLREPAEQIKQDDRA